MEHSKPTYNKTGVMSSTENLISSDHYPPSPEGGSFTFIPKPEEHLRLLQEQYRKDLYILDSAIEIGVDILEASPGAQIHPQHFENLYQNGFSDFSANEVLRVFDNDWDQLQGDIVQAYEERKTEKNKIRDQALKEMDLARKKGKLPPQLFYKIEKRISPDLSRKFKTKNNGLAYRPHIGRVTNEEAEVDEQLIRYCTFVAVKELVAELYPEDSTVNDYAIQRAILGVSLDGANATQGRLISHQYLSELRDSVNKDHKHHFNAEDLAHIAEAHGWHDYVFSEERIEHFEKILEKSGFKQPIAPQTVVEQVPAVAPEEIPKHYFDLRTGTIIEEQFLEAFKRSPDANEHNIHELGDLLRNPDIQIEPRTYLPYDLYINYVKNKKNGNLEKVNHRRQKRWTEKRFKQYGRWLTSTVKTSTKQGEKLLNRDIIDKAHRLGLGPSSELIIDRYKTMSNFYTDIGVYETKRVGIFNDWTTQDFVKYISQVGNMLGRRPTATDLNDLSKENVNNPHYLVIYNRSKNIGGLSKLLELAGWPVVSTWKEQDYVDWGVKFMRANNGKIPAKHALNFLSAKKIGPSSKSTGKKFKKIQFYQEKVQSAYDEEQDHKLLIEAHLKQIEGRINDGWIPAELYDNAPSEEELIQAFAKYKVLEKLVPSWPNKTKAIVSTGGINGRSFASSIQLISDEISAEDIESAAIELELFDVIWPMDQLTQRLKLDKDYDDYLEDVRKKDREKWHARRQLSNLPAQK
jgi:hypothetical protein